MKILESLATKKLSANLVAGSGLAFYQRYTSPLTGERDRSGTTCHSTTKDKNFIVQITAPGLLDVQSVFSRKVLFYLT
jgi:hypothetical protein